MKIAVVGTGIAGLTAAYFLRREHAIELFERNDYAGGHSNTIRVQEGGRTLDLDTGFLVHNPRNYPNLIRLFERLGVPTQETEMSFSSRCHRCGIEYRGSDFSTMFAQRANLVRPGFWWMIREIYRFHGLAKAALADPAWRGRTLREFTETHRFSRGFVDHFLLPFTAAIWSSPTGEAADMPAAFTLQFFENHGLLGRDEAPVWRSLVGGSKVYVAAIAREFGAALHLSRPIARVRREADGVVLRDATGREERFDAVILASHADESLAMLEDPSEDERRILSCFTYTPNLAVLHADEDALPVREPVRAAWNYEIEDCRRPGPEVSVTYSINRLMRLDSKIEYSVSLNRKRPIDARRVFRTIQYTHPRYTLEAFDAQQELPKINGQRRTWYCGAYFGYGFHEDGHVAGLRVAEKLGARVS
jgi:uncharacterized protein